MSNESLNTSTISNSSLAPTKVFDDVAPSDLPKLTIFSVPKAFQGHIGVIQRNAVRSWKQLGPDVEVILLGDESGVEQFASECDITHIGGIRTNEYGTPLLDDVFARATQAAQGKTILFSNCDIIFLSDLLEVIKQLSESDLESFLLIGRRVDVDLTEMIDFERADWEQELTNTANTIGKLAPVVCKDYFGFPKNVPRDLPAFAIGRGNWDNWMVHHSVMQSEPVIDCSKRVTAIHQNHGYAHLSKGRKEAYLSGDEAEENRKLGGGRHLISGCCPTWQMTTKGPERIRHPRSLAFFRDMPRFLTLLKSLFIR